MTIPSNASYPLKVQKNTGFPPVALYIIDIDTYDQALGLRLKELDLYPDLSNLF